MRQALLHIARDTIANTMGDRGHETDAAQRLRQQQQHAAAAAAAARTQATQVGGGATVEERARHARMQAQTFLRGLDARYGHQVPSPAKRVGKGAAS